MIFSPKFSIGAAVIQKNSGLKGKVVGIEGAIFIDGSNTTSRFYCMLELENGDIKKAREDFLKDVPEVSPDKKSELDAFLADSLMLSWNSDQERVNNTIKELLNPDSSGGDKFEHDDSALS